MNNNFEFLVEYTTAKITEWLMKERDMSLEEALVFFHNTETFEKLCDPATALYSESPGFVYEILQDEIRYGTIRYSHES